MNPKYRSRIEIISSILEASIGGTKKSKKVMCRSFVSINKVIANSSSSIDNSNNL